MMEKIFDWKGRGDFDWKSSFMDARKKKESGVVPSTEQCALHDREKGEKLKIPSFKKSKWKWTK